MELTFLKSAQDQETMLVAPTTKEYAKLLEEPRAWRDALFEVWRRHKEAVLRYYEIDVTLEPKILDIEQFDAGQNPVFKLTAVFHDSNKPDCSVSVVIKFYSPFHPEHQQPLETELLHFVHESKKSSLTAHTPKIFASGLLYRKETKSKRIYKAPSPHHDNIWPTFFLHKHLGRFWCWPYTVLEHIPTPNSSEKMWNESKENMSIDIPQLRELRPDLVNIAQFLGSYLRQLHDLLDPRHSPVLAYINRDATSNSSFLDSQLLWNNFEGFIKKQRFRVEQRYSTEWKHLLNSRQILELTQYLPLDATSLCTFQRSNEQYPSYLHGDLNEDHLLILPENDSETELINKRWKPLSVIDFGDSMLGDRHYDFVAIYVSTFRCNKSLMRVFLESYNNGNSSTHSPVILWPQHPEKFAYICMCYTLLHKQDALRTVFHHVPSLKNDMSLKEIEQALWML